MTGSISDWLDEIEDDGLTLLDDPEPVEPKIGRPRKYHPDKPATNAERQSAFKAEKRARNKQDMLEHLAIWDCETDPFDNVERSKIAPFVGCLWSPNFKPIIIWEENEDAFYEAFIAAVMALEGSYTIYAHNGGKFDFMFLCHKLRGRVSFKGRGIMSAKIGPHELRDSFHIIPEKLANYHKEEFDYSRMKKGNRAASKKMILDYLVSDCAYLYEFVEGFIEKFGDKISIGQTAMSELRKHYKVGRIGAKVDEVLREFFYGGRVECLAGKGHFKGRYKLYDRNSMYPASMAQLQHPIGSHYIRRERGRTHGASPDISPDTFFLELTCRNYGALVTRRKNPDTGEWETTTAQEYGRFKTTIWEYETALELGLIDRVKIHAVIDCPEKSDFSKFVLPVFEGKAHEKSKIDALTNAGDTTSREYFEAKREYMFHKFLLNTGYGKFAQNPRNFKETFITDADASAPDGFDQTLPTYRDDERNFAIWERPSPIRGFNNVGTAASITGASRANLMRVIHHAVDPIYCDTDSVICKSVSGIEIHPSKLGAWDLEKEMDEVIIVGKKLYGYRQNGQEQKAKIKSKGASGLTWDDLVKLLDGQIIQSVNKGVTLTRTGRQFYMTRNIRATAGTHKLRRPPISRRETA